MKLDAFVGDRRPFWDELDRLILAAGRRPERLGGERLLRLGALYRSAAADLAAARRRYPGDPVVAYLDGLVGRSRALVYGKGSARGRPVRFFARDYWVLVRERAGFIALASAFLLGSAALSAVWGADDPDSASRFALGQESSTIEFRDDPETGLTSSEETVLASVILTNNIRVSFLAFALGITAGIGTVLLLAYNGVVLGAVAGVVVSRGGGATFFELVTPHGVLELSVIIVSAAAGLKMGWTLVSPGRLRRRVSLVAEARRAVLVVLGTMPWFVIAGLVEGYVTGSGLGVAGAAIVGFGLGLVYWGLVVMRGTPARDTASAEPADGQNRALVLALR